MTIMSTQQQSFVSHDQQVPLQRGGPVATRVRLDHVHTCPTCGAPRRLVSQNSPDSSRLGTSEWHIVRIECAGSCCAGPDRPCDCDAG